MSARWARPKTSEDWQEAVNSAALLLAIDSCRQYGLITGGPEINAERCCRMIQRGRERGVVAAPVDELLHSRLARQLVV